MSYMSRKYNILIAEIHCQFKWNFGHDYEEYQTTYSEKNGFTNFYFGLHENETIIRHGHVA